MSSKSSAFSARFTPDVAKRLEQRGRRAGVPKSRLAERYVDEGMRMDDHPGIVFRDGPTGRRAGLAVGPDVWEVMSVFRRAPGPGEDAIQSTAEWLNLHPEEIRIAIRYYSEHPEEVDERIRRNEEGAIEAEAAWLREQAAREQATLS